MRKYFGIALDLLLTALAVLSVWTFAQDRISRSKFATVRGESRNPEIGGYIGDHGINWKDSKSNLVFLLKEDCIFCNKAAPFYKTILTQVKSKARTVALFPHGQLKAAAFLRSSDLSIQVLRSQVTLPWGSFTTPTILFCNEEGKIQRIWKGVIGLDSQSAVLQEIASEISSVGINLE